MSIRIFLCLSAAVVFAAGAGWASASNSHSIDLKLDSPTKVNGTLLKAGNYRLSWSDSGADKVDVTIEKGHKVVETTTAKLAVRAEATTNEEVISRTPKSGSHVLEEVRLPGDKTALVFAGS
jgi:hypothetical protein